MMERRLKLKVDDFNANY